MTQKASAMEILSPQKYVATPNPDWYLTFTIPDLKAFSLSVHDAIRTGVVKGRARREIIQVLRT